VPKCMTLSDLYAKFKFLCGIPSWNYFSTQHKRGHVMSNVKRNCTLFEIYSGIARFPCGSTAFLSLKSRNGSETLFFAATKASGMLTECYVHLRKVNLKLIFGAWLFTRQLETGIWDAGLVEMRKAVVRSMATVACCHETRAPITGPTTLGLPPFFVSSVPVRRITARSERLMRSLRVDAPLSRTRRRQDNRRPLTASHNIAF